MAVFISQINSNTYVHNVFHTRRDTAILRHMDEIIIEEKKYISSKRAAKMTGYAKDYIGQLCREGRVSARLVGRSWYVLESAIKDHRFGEKEAEPKESIPVHQEEVVSINSTPSSRYESTSVEVLPSINRLKEEGALSAAKEEVSEFSQRLQDSWSAWFDHIKDIEKPNTIEDVEPAAPVESKIDEKEQEEGQADEDIVVPIRVNRSIPKELLPSQRSIADDFVQEEEIVVQRSGSRAILVMQMAGSLFAVIFVALAVIGSGYMDTYVKSLSRVSILSGVVMYNK